MGKGREPHAPYSLQWGRNLFVAESCTTSRRGRTATRPSMGPQLVRCGKNMTPSTWSLTSYLQWGRNLFVAESLKQDIEREHSQRTPSMGPQLVRCGKSVIQSTIPLELASFNGAATCSLRKVATTEKPEEHASVLQWGRNLFVAESACSAACPRMLLRQPSMGPQLVRCGKHRA